jgi:hypothetical protein
MQPKKPMLRDDELFRRQLTNMIDMAHPLKTSGVDRLVGVQLRSCPAWPAADHARGGESGARSGAGGGAGTAQCATAPKAAPCWERGSAASFPRNKERERHWHRSLQGMCIFLIGNLADKFPENPLNFTDR